MGARRKSPEAAKAARRESTGGAKAGESNGPGGTVPSKAYCMRLYVAGQTSRSTAAIANLKKICEEHLTGRYAIEVIDLLKTPQLARDHQILAIPTLIRELPEPLKRVIGDLSNTERTLVGLDLRTST